MKKIIFILVLLFAFSSTQLYAARFGRGKSFGQQHRTSQNYNQSSSQNHTQQRSAPQQHVPTPPAKSSWTSKLLPALAGLSIGALLGSLLGGHGLGGALGSIFMIIAMLGVLGVLFALIKKSFASKNNNKSNYNYNYQDPSTQTQTTSSQSFADSNIDQNASYQGSNYHNYQPQNYSNSSSSNTYHNPQYSNNENILSNAYLPNKEEFLRTAKTIFIRMQNSYDHKNLDDIRNFTTSEVFSEIKMQIMERGNEPNQTDVIQINANLMDQPQATETFASVLFTGQLKEHPSSPPIDFREVWHFIKHHKDDPNWIIAGIEQTN